MSRKRAEFEAAMRAPGRDLSARVLELYDTPLPEAFARLAWCADLMVLAQPDHGRASGAVPIDFNESVLQASGRPAVIVPAVGEVPPAFENVAIAWKPGRECARAVQAALPLLRQARQVQVLAWSPPGESTAGLDLVGYLRLHNVQAHMVWREHLEEPSALGELLLSECFDMDAHLLVMGCYSRSRAREWVLGGVSRTILRSMTLPVLMSH